MAAALGTSVVAASGDSNGADTPSSAWWVTSVGGTTLVADAAGNVTSEAVWDLTGEGESLPRSRRRRGRRSRRPHGRRGMNDLAMTSRPSWNYFLGMWVSSNFGSEFSASAFAGLLALVQGERTSRGAPSIGCLNPILYRTPAVQQAFRDITAGSTLDRCSGRRLGSAIGVGRVPQASQLDLALP